MVGRSTLLATPADMKGGRSFYPLFSNVSLQPFQRLLRKDKRKETKMFCDWWENYSYYSVWLTENFKSHGAHLADRIWYRLSCRLSAAPTFFRFFPDMCGKTVNRLKYIAYNQLYYILDVSPPKKIVFFVN